MNSGEKQFVVEPERKIPVLADTGVLVIGGSQSGVAAAVSAKRALPGTRVMIVEQNGYLGGQAVSCMVVQWEFREFTNNEGQVIAKGIGKEIISRIVEKGNSDPLFKEWLEGKGPPFKGVPDGRASNDVPLELEDIKLVLAEMCEEEGIDVLLHSRAVGALPPEKTSNGFPASRGVFVETPNGKHAITARVVVDCSANADMAWWIGGERAAEVPEKVAVGMQAYAWIDNVDLVRFVNEGVFGDCGGQPHYPLDKQQMLDHVKQGKTIMAKGFTPIIDKAYEAEPDTGDILDESGMVPQLSFYMKTVRTKKVSCGDGMEKHVGTFAIEGPRFNWHQLDPLVLSRAEIQALKAVRAQFRMHRYLPGWENAILDRTVAAIGLRQTRIPIGLYRITKEDIFEHRRFKDVIGRHTGHDIGRHVPGGEFGYDIPYRALVPAEIDGLLFGARCISVESIESDPRATALNAHRGISATMIVSQAAGVAAALCVKHGIEPRQVNVKELQDELRKQDVVLEPPE